MNPPRPPARARPIALACLLFCLGVTPAVAAAQGPEIRIDPRVELLSLVFRLAGNPEYNMCRFPRYQEAADAWFAPYREAPVVQLARDARSRAGVSFDAVQSLAIHLGPVPALTARAPLTDTTLALDRRWRRVDVEAFAAALRDFATSSRFEAFLASQRPMTDSVAARLRTLFEAETDFSWFDRFFGARPAARFQLTPGLCNGAGNFGPRFRDVDGREELYAIVGVFQVDSTGLPVFRRSMVATIVHEFNHSYVNPLFDGAANRFAGAVGAIYPKVAEEMRAQAYGSAQTMLNESIVRAGVIRYLAATQGDSAAQSRTREEVGLGFVWMPELVARLGEYEHARDRYPTFGAFVPRLAVYWDSLAPRVDGLLANLEAQRPHLMAMEPADGDTLVPPTRRTIILRFDRRMGGGYSINPGPGGDATYPQIGELSWDSTGTTLTMEVTLAPARRYELALTGQGFRSADGVPLRRRIVSFGTRPRD